MENKLKVWIARDEDGNLYVYFIHPFKGKTEWRLPDFVNEDGIGAKRLDSDLFPSVKWEDEEPTEAYITLAEPQEQTKQEQSKQERDIDWEQRRYEIAKEMMPMLYRHGMEAQKHGQSVKRKDTAYYAVIFADMLIEELMKSE